MSGIVRKRGSVYSFPLFMALLKSKSKKAYIRMLTYMKQTYRAAYHFETGHAPLSPNHILSDFESGFITSVETLFPNSRIGLCQSGIHEREFFLGLVRWMNRYYCLTWKHNLEIGFWSLNPWFQTHLNASTNRFLSRLKGGTSLPAESKLNEIYYLWSGASYLNISTSARHDITLKQHMIHLAQEELNDEQMSRFTDYLDLYFSRDGVYRIDRYDTWSKPNVSV